MDARNYIIKSMDISKNENIRQYKKKYRDGTNFLAAGVPQAKIF